jgi:tungstate transport system ATP-binding protein
LYQLRDVAHRYGSGFTLTIDRLAVARGSIVCLVGPTGAGKSTLLRLLSGLEPPTSGAVEFESQPLHPASPISSLRRITSVAQRPLPLSGTVRHNVEYGLRLRRDAAAPAKAEAMLQTFNLSALASQQAGTLSGGQTQLVGLARALVIGSDVLLLDEPTSNLDPAHVALIENAVLETQRRNRITIVWATHNLFQARRVASDVALLLDGKIIEFAPVEKFFHEPSDPRTAAFLNGEMIY